MASAGPLCSPGLRQRGAALIATLILFTMIGVTALLAFARATDGEAERDRRTSAALATAKAALLGFAGGVALTGAERPGDLPCPDLDNDGSADPPCSTEASRLGRLPWKTLGLPDLRDGEGERLWYAVSFRFRNNPRETCANHADTGCLNSETRGTITVRDSAGTVTYDGAADGAIAVVISPGGVLTREDSPGSSQVRDAAGINNPANYLEVQPAGGEDNADFLDGSTNGFIAGPLLGANDRLVVNDRLLAIGHRDLMPVLERRVAQEVALCLAQYAVTSGQKFPWAADMIESGLNNRYHDFEAPAARVYGRIPDEPFTRTQTDDAGMGAGWTGACKVPVTGAVGQRWWTNWKSQVLYAIAPGFAPGSTAACGSCLTVNRPGGGSTTNVRSIVMVAGRALAAQNRSAPPGTVNTNPANYVEFENATSIVSPDPLFEVRTIDAVFNDRLAYLP